jgi:hypothetical protein
VKSAQAKKRVPRVIGHYLRVGYGLVRT